MNALRDENFVSVKIGLLNSDGKTIVPLAVDPTNHSIGVSDGTTGTDFGPQNSVHDDNGVTTMIGVSSADFSTPVVVYVDSSGKLLINSH
jgi:hypothetical protein